MADEPQPPLMDAHNPSAKLIVDDTHKERVVDRVEHGTCCAHDYVGTWNCQPSLRVSP